MDIFFYSPCRPVSYRYLLCGDIYRFYRNPTLKEIHSFIGKGEVLIKHYDIWPCLSRTALAVKKFNPACKNQHLQIKLFVPDGISENLFFKYQYFYQNVKQTSNKVPRVILRQNPKKSRKKLKGSLIQTLQQTVNVNRLLTIYGTVFLFIKEGIIQEAQFKLVLLLCSRQASTR